MKRGVRLLVVSMALIALLPAAAAPRGLPPVKPLRIMSLNQCTDLLLLQLVSKDRIASISYVSREDVAELFPGADRGIAVNRGTAEDIVNQKPDLILAGDFSTPVARRFARRVGARLVEIRSAASFADARAILRQVGAAVGESERAEGLVRRMDAGLGELTRSAGPPRRVVAWSGGTTVPGRNTFANAIFEAAGAVNIAAQPGGGYSSYDVERLLQARPEALLYVGASDREVSMQSAESRHRIVRTLFDGRQLPYSEAAASCGLPQSVDMALALRRGLDALPARGRVG